MGNDPPKAPPEDVSASELAEFLRSHREAIVERWHEAVRDRPSVKGLSVSSLIDHIPDLLDAIAETGEARLEDPRARLSPETAGRHAIERLMEGLDLAQVVVELAVLRDCVLLIWDRERAPGAARPEVRFLNRSVDRAMTESIERYVAARDRTLHALDRISAAALESRRLDDLLERLLRVLLETTPAVDTGVIFLRDGDDLVLRAAVGLEEDADRGLRVRIGEGFDGQIASARRPHLLSDTETGPDGVHSPVLRGRRLRCLYGVPLAEDGDVIGVAHLGSLTAPGFSDQDRRLIGAMVARASSGIVQHQLRELAERRATELATVIESIPHAVLVGDRHGITSANRAALMLLGLDAVEEINTQAEVLVGRMNIRRLATGEVALPESRPFARALKGEHVVDELLVRNDKSHEDVALRVAAAPIHSGDRVRGAVMVATDITAQRRDEEERKALLEAARQAVADREHALAVVSHDLRNPLNTIGMAAATLQDGRVDAAFGRRAVQSITRAVGRMNRLISDLLDFSSIQAGRLSCTMAPVDAASVVDEAVAGAREEAEARGLEIRKHATALLIRADRDRLLQALGNVLGNSIKATKEGSIQVSVTREGDKALFVVKDTGPGIPPDLRDRIFEPYWRAQNPSYKGTGLGLAIAKSIIEAHGGRIWLDSPSGPGAAFHFTMPLATSVEAPTSEFAGSHGADQRTGPGRRS